MRLFLSPGPPSHARKPVVALIFPKSAREDPSHLDRLQVLGALESELGGDSQAYRAPHSGARGCPSKSSARIVCGCSALAMSRLLEYPSKHLKLTKGARRSAPIR